MYVYACGAHSNSVDANIRFSHPFPSVFFPWEPSVFVVKATVCCKQTGKMFGGSAVGEDVDSSAQESNMMSSFQSVENDSEEKYFRKYQAILRRCKSIQKVCENEALSTFYFFYLFFHLPHG